MSSLNKVLLIGNLGADPEVRYTTSGDAVTNIRIATTDTWKDKASGEQKQATEWHRIVFYRRLAEIAGEYLKKGAQVYIEGRIKTRKWQDKEGKDQYTTEIEATEMKMLGKREGGSADPFEPADKSRSNQAEYAAASGGTARPATTVADLDEELPF